MKSFDIYESNTIRATVDAYLNKTCRLVVSLDLGCTTQRATVNSDSACRNYEKSIVL